MSERENIFNRIREALTVPAVQPHDHGTAAASARHPSGPLAPIGVEGWGEGATARRVQSADAPIAAMRRVLPAVGVSFDEHAALFARNAVELRADFKLLPDFAAIISELKRTAAAENWTQIATHQGALTDPICAGLGLPILRTDQPYDKHALEKVAAGISECDALVAQTGSVVVTTRSAGGRALSVLPPHHIVLARRDQLVADLPEAFALVKKKYGVNYPSMISFITGPSRTGDIERILVLGAHGPKKLTIFCV